MTRTITLMFSRWLLAGALCALTMACKQEATAPAKQIGAEVAAPVMEAIETGTPEAVPPGTWEEGMGYDALRVRVLARGWQPRVDAQCRANVVGANHQALCRSDPSRCTPCEVLPELSSCSGTGHCTLQFERDGGQLLTVFTYGDVHQRTPSGEHDDLMVTSVEPATY